MSQLIDTIRNGTASKDVSASLLFLHRDALHKEIKPYKLKYDPGNSLPRTNTTNEACPVIIHDLRESLHLFSYEKNGFAVLDMESELKPDDFYNKHLVESVYYSEIKKLLLEYFHAKRVEVMEHVIRKRDPGFPISTGEQYQYTQPTSIVHVDYTMSSALDASDTLLKIDSSKYERVQCVNVWKPLWGPLTDWPLAVCDVESVDPTDIIASDVVTRTGFTENGLVYFNPEHRWYYLSDQMPSELVVFRQADTLATSQIGVPHSGFQNPRRDSRERPRESIEIRVMIYY